MVKIELIYEKNCPNAGKTREALRKALQKMGLREKWIEWERESPDAPEYAKAYASPTVLVNGRDVAGEPPQKDLSACRLYRMPDGSLSGSPAVEMIIEAISKALKENNSEPGAGSSKKSKKFAGFLAVLPAVIVSLLPAGICPACWPAYAGLLSALGLGILLKEKYLFPLTAIFLLVAVVTLGYSARTSRKYGPFLLGLVASGLVLGGKIFLQESVPVYGGVILLVAASIWNAWPSKATGGWRSSCPACIQNETNKIKEV